MTEKRELWSQEISLWTGTFVDPTAEAAFRASTWHANILQLKLALAISMVCYLAGSVVDYYLAASDRIFFFLLILRLVSAGYAISTLRATVWPSDQSLRLDRVVCSVLLVISAATLGIIALSSGGILFHTMTVLILSLVYYLFIPIRFQLSSLSGILFSAGFVPVGILSQDPRPAEIALMLLYLVLTNSLGLVTSLTLNRLRRSQFARLEEAKSVNRKLKREVEERIRAEKSLAESEERYRGLVELFPDMILVHRNFKALYVNPAGLGILGLEPTANMSGQNFLPFVLPEFQPVVLSRMETITQTGAPLPPLEFKARIGDRIVYCEAVSGPINFDGELAVLSVLRDITDRKKAEEALTLRGQIEKRINALSTAFIDVPTNEIDALIEKSLEILGTQTGVDRARILNLASDKQRFEILCQWTKVPDLARENTFSNLPLDRYPWLFREVSARRELTIRHLDDLPSEASSEKAFWAGQSIHSLVYLPLTSRSGLLGILGFEVMDQERSWTEDDLYPMKMMADIIVGALERVRHEREILLAKEEAETANRAKSDFLASMSHEIRTPMNIILGLVDIMMRADLEERLKEYLGTVKDSARHLLDIITNILDLAKIEARRMELALADFDLHQKIETLARTWSFQAQSKGLTMTLDLDPNVPRYVQGDPGRLNQILMNLLGNAVKFTERGKIRLEVKRLPDPEPQPRAIPVSFSVSDTGPGVPMILQESIFESFRQADHSSTRRHGGTGLGLAISQQLATLMGGKIHLESIVGQGSTFSFVLHFSMGQPDKTTEIKDRPPEPLPSPKRTARILLVEDNPISAKVGRLLLMDMGHQVVLAANGREAIETLGGKQFDLVLMDLEMPEMDGFQATELIRSRTVVKDPDVPIIAMTAHALQEYKERCYEAGMDDFLTKPVNFHILSEVINRHFPKRRIFKAANRPHPLPVLPDQPIQTMESARKALGVNQETFDRIILSALNELEKLNSEISNELSQGNLENVRRQAHTIVGIMGNIGAESIRTIARKLERSAGQNNEKDARDLEDELATEIQNFLTEIRPRLTKNST